MINSIIYEQFNINGDVPLIVLTTPHESLEFAKMVMELFHSDEKTRLQILTTYRELMNRLSVCVRRKLYDIFPEEFITIPENMYEGFFELVDNCYEFTPDDVEDLKMKLSH